jgi:hypothetical protein
VDNPSSNRNPWNAVLMHAKSFAAASRRDLQSVRIDYLADADRRSELGLSMKSSYYVKALWDPEAAVWISESDIPGLVIEASTLTEFEVLIWNLAPEVLAANEDISGARVSIDFSATTRRELAIA